MPKCNSEVGSFPVSGAGLQGPEHLSVSATFAQATGQEDASDIIQAAIADALSLGIGRVFLPRGTYRIDKTITISIGGLNNQNTDRQLELVGDFAVLRAGGIGASPVLLVTGWQVAVRGLIIDCNGMAAVGLHVRDLNHRHSVVQEVTVARSLTDGIVVEGCQGAAFRECVSRCNAGNGWRLLGNNATHFASCSASNNNGSGFVLSGLDHQDGPGIGVYPGGSYITRLTSEFNGLHGVELSQPFNLLRRTVGYYVVRDGIVRENRGHGIVIDSRNALVTGLWITAATDDSFAWSRGIVVGAATRNVYVFGNYLSASTGPDGYKKPQYDATQASIVIDDSNFGFESD